MIKSLIYIFISPIDVNDLRHFVKIALAAVGSESECTDRLSYLRTVGSGFGLLIYKLPKDADYELLHEHCKELCETLEQTGIIPEIMVNISAKEVYNY